MIIAEVLERLRREDPEFKDLFLHGYTDLQLDEVVECLISHPNVASLVWLSGNKMTSAVGVKIAHFLAVSSAVQRLDLQHNRLDDATFLAIAEALRVNTSLKILSMIGNVPQDKNSVDAAFTKALRLNPHRPRGSSSWSFYTYRDDFVSCRDTANALGAPSMLVQLMHAKQLQPAKIK